MHTSITIYSPDGRYIFTKNNQHGITQWASSDLTEVNSITPNDLGVLVNCASLDSSGAVLAVAGVASHNISKTAASFRIRLWDIEEWSTKLAGFGSYANVSIAPRGDRLALGTHEGVVSEFYFDNFDRPQILCSERAAVTALDYSSDGSRLGIGYEHTEVPGRVRICDGRTRRLDRTFSGGLRGGPVNALAFGSNGFVGTSLRDDSVQNVGNLQVTNAEDGRTVRSFDGYTTRDITFSRDGESIYSIGRNSVTALDIAGGKELFVIDTTTESLSADLSPDGRLLAVAGGGIQLFDAKTGQPSRTARGKHRVMGRFTSSVSFSPDGKKLASNSAHSSVKETGSVSIWDVEDGELVKRIRIGPAYGQVVRTLFTPDGRHVVTLNGNGTIYILRLQEWPVAANKE